MAIAVVVGTRPEAVKMAPVHRALARRGLDPILISTGQHLDLIRTAMHPLGLVPDHELAIMTPDQTPNMVAAKVLERMPPILTELRPAAVLVQGDTTSAIATALAAYHLGIPVGHVEAGLRTYDNDNPFPEEANRQMLARISTWSFAPTEQARVNLLAERVAETRVHVTGNTVVDALRWILERTPRLDDSAPYLLLTLHRRESFGEPLREVLAAVEEFLRAVPTAEVRWPVHPNPHVRTLAEERFHDHPRVKLLPPLEYDVFAATLGGARLVLSDSGGVQEEAPSLGKIVLVARDTTERPEAIASGHNRLVGRDRRRILEALQTAWFEPAYEGPLPAPNPYGDGTAGERIAELIEQSLRA